MKNANEASAGTSFACCAQPSGHVDDWNDCDDGDAEVNPGGEEVCDGVDNDCDGLTDEDAAFLLEPELAELAADGLDNNCNGLVDEPGGVMVPLVNRTFWPMVLIGSGPLWSRTSMIANSLSCRPVSSMLA